MINAERLIQEFMEIVQIDSESGAERQIADLLKQRLIDLGLEVFEDEASSVEVGIKTGNLIATLPANGGNGSLLLLSAHMDTVKPGRGIKPLRQDGRITSAGDTILGSDDKAGVVSIMECLRAIKENKLVHGGLQVVFTVGEEIGLVGAKQLDYNLVQAKLGFVLDSGGPPGEIIIKAPTQYSLEAKIIGKAAHAGIAPEQGINSIVVAAHAISKMHIGRIDDETTSNIGIISGGVAANIVPEQTFIKGEARSINAQKAKEQIDKMENEINKAAKNFAANAEIKIEKEYDSIDLDTNALPVRIAVSAAHNIGLEPMIGQTGGGSDANVFNGRGIACANLGIGMSKVHTTEEFITEENLVANAKFLLEIIKVAQEIKE